MALVNVVNMVVLDNPTCFLNPFQFEITFECLQELEDDLEWKVLYVGSAHDSHMDQVLDEILVGPVPVGLNKFVLQADAPDPSKLPNDEILGVTVVLVTCSYQEREFVRVGYYVNNEYTEPSYVAAVVKQQQELEQQKQQQAATAAGEGGEGEQQQQQQAGGGDLPKPPSYPDIDMKHVQRQILADKPRVTKFPIPWGKQQQTSSSSGQQQQQNQAGAANIGAEEQMTTVEGKQHELGDNIGAGTPSTVAASSPAGSPMQMD